MIRLKSLLLEQSIKPLVFGDKNSDVKKMQQQLMKLGYSVGHKKDDGWFGNLTKHGVEEFQKQNKLPVTGTADIETLKLLNSSNAKKVMPVIQPTVQKSEPELKTDISRPLVVTSSYGYRKAFKRMHKGTDYAANTGTEIKVLQLGRVEVADMNRDPDGWGALVQIKHPDGSVTRYAHLSRIDVQVGDEIQAGTIIGQTGGNPGDPGAGRSTGAHLHWEYIPSGSNKQVDGEGLANKYFTLK